MVGFKDHKWRRNLVIGLTMAFFYLPIIIMIVFSFNDSKSLSNFTGFSFRWYEQLFKDRDIIEAVWTSTSIALLATLVSTVIGTITAIGLSKSRKIIRESLLYINDFPIMNPEIVTAISMMLLFSFLKMDLGYLTMLLAHIAFCIPYVILSVLPKIRNLDPNITEAAMDLGATPYQAMTKVIIPQIKPGIISGILLAFTMSFDDFVISYFVNGNGATNISIYVYTMSRRINPTINSLSTLLVVVITVILLFVNIVPLIKEKGKKNNEKMVS